jgi:oligopeptide/dipeptide ABC transporter ATP-binding protein
MIDSDPDSIQELYNQSQILVNYTWDDYANEIENPDKNEFNTNKRNAKLLINNIEKANEQYDKWKENDANRILSEQANSTGLEISEKDQKKLQRMLDASMAAEKKMQKNREKIEKQKKALEKAMEKKKQELLQKLDRKMAVVLITHNIGVAASIADRIAIMYAGRIVETGTAREVLESPKHPYTQALLSSMPRIGSSSAERLTTISGTPPSLATIPKGCAFHPRCTRAIEICKTTIPTLSSTQSNKISQHSFACHNPKEGK